MKKGFEFYLSGPSKKNNNNLHAVAVLYGRILYAIRARADAHMITYMFNKPLIIGSM